MQQSQRFRALSYENQQIITALLGFRESITDDLCVQITALSQLLDRSTVVIADQEDRTRRLIVDVFQNNLISDLTDEKGRIASLLRRNEASIRRSVEEELLQSLRFPTITERFEEIIESHRLTFQWIFQGLGDGTHTEKGKWWSDFPEWLRSGTGIYWINGKPASGKSTLMKYIFTQPETLHNLKKWGAFSPPEAPFVLLHSSSGSVVPKSRSPNWV